MRRVLVALACSTAIGAALSQPLMLHYQERPPYSSAVGNGTVVGLVASPAERALRGASIPFIWTLTPGQRQLALIQSDSGLHCGVGWFRTAEREALGKFTQALYRDRPFGALVRDQLPLASGLSAADLLRDRRYRLLVKEGYSYGKQFDALIAEAPQAPERTNADTLQMSRMLLAGRADWMIVAPEEAAALREVGLRLISFGDLPEGPQRHLYCSREVPSDWIVRIDHALGAPGK